MAVISVILPTYNSVETIERALQSVFAQTFGDWELIVVDDASTDHTVQLVGERCGDDARVRIIRRESNGGPARARNLAFQHATAEWIALLDSDDAWHCSRLSTLYSGRDGFDFVADNIMTYDHIAHAETGPLFDNFDATTLTLDDLLLGWVGNRRVDAGYLKPLMRSQFLRDWELSYNSTLRHGEDFLFYCEALCRRARFGLLNHPGYIYTTEVGRVSKRSSPYSRTTPDPIAMADALRLIGQKYHEWLDPEEREALTRLTKGLSRSKWTWMYEGAKRDRQYRLCLKLIACHRSVLKHILQQISAELGIVQRRERPRRR